MRVAVGLFLAAFATGASAQSVSVDGGSVEVATDPNALAAHVTRQNNVYAPPGAANYSIVAQQGINAAHQLGDSAYTPLVNTDFEFSPSIGVTYQKVNGTKVTLTDFGIGLYKDTAGNVVSSGLEILYNVPVFASSITMQLEDFDINTSATFFNPNKVEPTITLLGANNVVLAVAGPSAIFPNLVSVSAASGGHPDIWSVNFAGLLTTLHLADLAVKGVLLSADVPNGEKPNSDPYLLLSVGNGIQVPEPSSIALLLGSAGLLLCSRSVRRRR